MQQPPYSQQASGNDYGYPHSPQMPPQAAPKKQRRWPWIVAILVALVIGYGAGSASHSSTTTTIVPAATTQATTAPTTVSAKPTVAPKASGPIFQQSGNGELTTKPFTTTGTWTLQWSCTPSTVVPEAPIFITVLDEKGQDTLTGDISTTCKTGNASGASNESQTGTVKLHIISGIDWTVKAVPS